MFYWIMVSLKLLFANLITNNYFTYVNAFTLVHLSVFEFASIFV